MGRGHEHGEQRWVGLGCVRREVVNVVFTPRGNRVRVISLKRALRRERQADFRALQRTESV